MYQDQTLLRDNVIKLSLNVEEKEILQAAANRSGLELAEYCRTVAVARVLELLRSHNIV